MAVSSNANIISLKGEGFGGLRTFGGGLAVPRSPSTKKSSSYDDRGSRGVRGACAHNTTSTLQVERCLSLRL